MEMREVSVSEGCESGDGDVSYPMSLISPSVYFAPYPIRDLAETLRRHVWFSFMSAIGCIHKGCDGGKPQRVNLGGLTVVTER